MNVHDVSAAFVVEVAAVFDTGVTLDLVLTVAAGDGDGAGAVFVGGATDVCCSNRLKMLFDAETL